MLRRLIQFLVIVASTWALLVYGVPAVRAFLPWSCARWSLEGGICTPETQDRLARSDAWIQRTLRPLPRHARARRAVREVSSAFASLEQLIRQHVGDERVDDALRGTDVALQKLEAMFGKSGDAKKKVAAIPENAEALLVRARAAFDRLRAVLGTSSRRAEEVSGALEETKDALDALSSVLPETTK